MAILTEYSIWLSLLCILIGVLFSFLLYYKNKDIDFGKRNLKLLMALRGLSIALIAFLLLAPLTKMTLKKTEKPILLFALDQSESIISGADSNYYKNEFPKQYKSLISQFGDKYDVILYSIGDNSRKVDENSYGFSDKSTQISDLFEEMNTIYANRNIGAVVLASDGIINKGSNPIYSLKQSKFPVYTIGMGNPDIQTDLFIAGITHNAQTFKGNIFPVEIKVAANKLKGKNAQLSIFQGENEVFSTYITIANNQFFTTIKTNFEAKSKGMLKYRVVLTQLEGEVTYKNNTSPFYIEVVDEREKIAIIYNAPHPDIAAIKSALELSDKYQLDVMSIDEFKGSLNPYSLVILHQLPSLQNSAQNLINEIQKTKTSVLYVLGPKSNLSIFNTLKSGVSIVKNKDLTNESLPAYNNNFISFTFSEEAKQLLPKLPPLVTQFGDYNVSVGANVFFYQKIGGVATNYPLIVFNDQLGLKSGVITGSGIWQWKLYNHLYTDNCDVFNEIINKMALYLFAKGDKSLFRVNSKNLYNENDQINFNAELYNESYELINTSDVNMVIQSSTGKKYPYQFSKNNNSYQLNIGELPPDDYTWIASTQFGSKTYNKSGAFSVRQMMVENQNLIANHQLLNEIAIQTKGKFYKVQEMSKLENDLKSNENIKSIATYHKNYNMLLNSIIYFLMIVLLLGCEWFIRKWNGGY